MEDKTTVTTSSSSSNLAVPSSDKGERSPRREKKDKDKERRSSSGNVVADIMQLMTRQTGIVHEKDITECPVEFVTVYSDRAEVTRKVTAKIEREGVQKITIQGFPSTAVEQSFRMSGGAGHATIFEVGLETKTITTQPEPVPVDFTNRLEEIPVEIDVLNTNLQCLEEEKRWLNDVSQNKKHIHENNIMGLEEIANYFKFFAESMARLNGEMHQIRQKITTLRKEEQQIRDNIAKRGVTHSYSRRDFSITFYSPGDTKLVLQVTYLVTNVNFSTMYDIRVGMNPPEPLSCQLMYFAEVRNNSSEDWTNVKMAISTARPAIGSKPPKLAARRLRIHVPTVPRQQRRFKSRMRDVSASVAKISAEEDVYMESDQLDISDDENEILPEVAIVTSTVEQSALGSVTFHVPQPCNVPADGKGHKICIAMISLDMKIVHEAVPSLSSSVFMRASGKNTSPYLLLPGNINVFLNGSFLTTSSLALTNKDEDLQFYLGVDDSVKLVIKPEEVITGKTGIIKKSKTENTKRSITIKNTKPIPIDIQITEQCPTSQDDSIKIKLHEPEIKEIDKSIVRDEQNNLRWTLNIGAGKEKAIGYHYSIEYPADKAIEYF